MCQDAMIAAEQPATGQNQTITVMVTPQPNENLLWQTAAVVTCGTEQPVSVPASSGHLPL